MICTFSFIVVLSVQRNFHKLLQPFKNGKYQQILIYEGDVRVLSNNQQKLYNSTIIRRKI